MPDFSEIRRPPTRAANQVDTHTPQLNVGFGLTTNNDQNQTQIHNQSQNSETNRDYRPELIFRGGKVAAKKHEVFSKSMNKDEWIESLQAYLAGTNPNAATDQVFISQVKSFLSATALKRVKHIFRREISGYN